MFSIPFHELGINCTLPRWLPNITVTPLTMHRKDHIKFLSAQQRRPTLAGPQIAMVKEG